MPGAKGRPAPKPTREIVRGFWWTLGTALAYGLIGIAGYVAATSLKRQPEPAKEGQTSPAPYLDVPTSPSPGAGGSCPRSWA